MADIHCYDDNSSYSLFHSSVKEMTPIQRDGISDLILLDSNVEVSFLNL